MDNILNNFLFDWDGLDLGKYLFEYNDNGDPRLFNPRLFSPRLLSLESGWASCN